MTASAFSKIRGTLIILSLLLFWGTGIDSISYRQQIQHPELAAALATPGEALEPTPDFLSDVFSATPHKYGLGLSIWPARLPSPPLSASWHRDQIPAGSALPRPPPAG
jgi:hypothetical protein